MATILTSQPFWKGSLINKITNAVCSTTGKFVRNESKHCVRLVSGQNITIPQTLTTVRSISLFVKSFGDTVLIKDNTTTKVSITSGAIVSTGATKILINNSTINVVQRDKWNHIYIEYLSNQSYATNIKVEPTVLTMVASVEMLDAALTDQEIADEYQYFLNLTSPYKEIYKYEYNETTKRRKTIEVNQDWSNYGHGNMPFGYIRRSGTWAVIELNPPINDNKFVFKCLTAGTISFPFPTTIGSFTFDFMKATNANVFDLYYFAKGAYTNLTGQQAYQFRHGSDNKIYLYKITNTTRTQLAVSTLAYTHVVMYQPRITVTAEGNHSVYLDDVLVCEATDVTYTGGNLMVFDYDANDMMGKVTVINE